MLLKTEVIHGTLERLSYNLVVISCMFTLRRSASPVDLRITAGNTEPPTTAAVPRAALSHVVKY